VEPLRIRPRLTGLPISWDDQVATRTPFDTHEATIDLNGSPIDFAAYQFDPHTLLAILLLSLAIAILVMTALVPTKLQMRKRKAFCHIVPRMRVRIEPHRLLRAFGDAD
jgi:hypothetical protein